jgi:hypothetical protein
MGVTNPPVAPLDPVAFAPGWLLGGVALALAAVAIMVVPRLWARRRRPQAAPVPPPDPAARRASALAEIDRLEAGWAAGELTARTAAQGVAAAVKGYAGGEAEALTLLDLKVRGAEPTLVAVIEAAYPVEFGVTGEGDVAELARRARRAVSP